MRARSGWLALVALTLFTGLPTAEAGDLWRKVGVGYGAGYHAGGVCTDCIDGAAYSEHYGVMHQGDPGMASWAGSNWTQSSAYCPWPRKRPLWWMCPCLKGPPQRAGDWYYWRDAQHWQPSPHALGH